MTLMYHNYHYCVCNVHYHCYCMHIQTLISPLTHCKIGIEDQRWWEIGGTIYSHYPEVSTASYKPNKNPIHLLTDGKCEENNVL